MATKVESSDEDNESYQLGDGSSTSRSSPDSEDITPYMVAAIDFGTTYSGIAHSFKHEFRQDPLKIICHQWHAKSAKRLISQKMPTTLLLTPSEEFEAFGFEAEETYSNLVDENAHHNWRYFKHFKMNLHKPPAKLNRNTKLKDDQGQETLALTVFAESISFFKRMLHKAMKNKAIQPTDDSITWVITIPAIWDDDAKQFMREAAVEAGINGKHLKLALEPEAASIYCKEIHVQRKASGDQGEAVLTAYDPGTKYMVVDLGGGTADFTVREVMKDRTLREVLCASGEAWGGMNVNKEFWKFIEDFVGKDKMDHIFRDCKAEQLDLERTIEQQKRDLTPDEDGAGISLHLGALNEYVDENSAKKLQNTVRKGKIEMKKGRLKIPVSKIQEFFAPSVENIKQHLTNLFKRKETQGVENVILVGGFAESKIMQESIRAMLRDKTIVIPQESGLAVLRGAVLYGHNPGIVSGRMSKYTYGTETHRFFLKGFDDEKQRDKKHCDMCKEVFNKLIEKDTLVNVGETILTDVYPLTADMTRMSIRMFYSEKKDPKYTSDKGCTYMGKLSVDMPDTRRGLERKVVVSLYFGETELVLDGRDETTGKTAKVSLDTLEGK